MNEILKLIEKFHGHLGPYAVLGYRMGLIANEKIGTDCFSKNAIVFTGNNPPLSCIIDGLQLSSGCTLGKGNIEVIDGDCAKVVFSKKSGEKIEIKLKDNVREEIDKIVNEGNMVGYSQDIYKKTDQDLFEISWK